MGQCLVCGHHPQAWAFQKITTNHLAQTWRLTADQRHQFDLRESQFCPRCGSSTRTRALAEAIIKSFPFPKTVSFGDWIKKANQKKLAVAEINPCGQLHQFFKKIQCLAFSEHHPQQYHSPIQILKKIQLMINRVPDQDLANLSYPDNSFDLVLHSDTLEHLPDPVQALKECRRVLKPGGRSLFTTPVIFERQTRQRAKLDQRGRLVNLKPASYHGLRFGLKYLVFWEFGGDFVKNQGLKTVVSDPQTNTFVFALSK